MQRWSKRCHCLGNFEILWCWQVTTDKRHLTSDNWRTWTSIMLDSQHCQLLVARFAISHSAQLFDFSLGLNSTLTSSDKLDLLENISVTLSYQIVWADLVCTAKKGRDFVHSHSYCSRLFCIHVWNFPKAVVTMQQCQGPSSESISKLTRSVAVTLCWRKVFLSIQFSRLNVILGLPW